MKIIKYQPYWENRTTCYWNILKDGVDFISNNSTSLCTEFHVHPYVCVGFLWVLWFPPQNMLLGGLAILDCL